MSGGANQPLEQTGAPETKVTTLGIDLAENLFQLHGVNECGETVIKKKLCVAGYKIRRLLRMIRKIGISPFLSFSRHWGWQHASE
jgi:hypothetical protein